MPLKHFLLAFQRHELCPSLRSTLRRVSKLSSTVAFSILLFLLWPRPAATAQNTIRVPADQLTIQAGINAAANGDTVLVAAGTYYENIDFKGKAITVKSSAGPATTIIDGRNITSTVSFISGETRSSILNGFTVQHGQSPGNPNNQGEPLGGGIYIESSAPTILNNVITNNICSGIYSSQGAPLIQGNTVRYTDNDHSGCYFSSDAPIMLYRDLQSIQTSTLISTVTANTIENNTLLGAGTTSQSFAAGVGVLDAAASIQNNIIRNNTAHGDNGGISLAASPGTAAGGATFVIQNLIYGNSSYCGGAGLGFEFNSPSNVGAINDLILNNTIVNNINLPAQCPVNNPGQGNVVTYWTTDQVAFVNNIISSNGSAPALFCFNRPGLSNTVGPITIFDHNDIYSSTGNTYSTGCSGEDLSYGNISADPAFISPATGDFRLSQGSPAIDVGNNSAAPLPQQDLGGNPRITDATGRGYPIVDLGAYEYVGNVTISPTALLLTPSVYEVAGGQSLSLKVQLFTALGPFSGFVQLFDNHSPIGSGSTDSTGSLTISSPALAPGIHHLLATFAGDSTHPAATSVEVIVLADLYIPAITLKSSPNPSSQGQPVIFTVNITSLDNAVLSPVNLVDVTSSTTLAVLTPDSSGNASFTTSSLPVGGSLIEAKYAGDSTHQSAQAALLQTVINTAATTTTLSTSLDPAPPGQVVTFTATVATAPANGTPTGSITFSEGNTILASQSLADAGAGQATTSFSTSSLSLGTHFIYATYVPSGGLTASSTSIAQIITNVFTTAALISSPNPANVGQLVTFSATITNTTSIPGAPAGTITFSDGNNVLGTQMLASSGAATSVATFSTASLSIGTHTIQAAYSPIGLFLGSSAQRQQTVIALPSVTTINAAPNPANFGQTVTLQAGVNGAVVTAGSAIPTGTITFYDGAASIGIALLNSTGHATFSTTALAAGTHSLTAIYSGDTIYSASTSISFAEIIQALPQDFTLTLASPTITIQTQHHTTTTVTLASVNGFADSIATVCANLPQYVTCKPTPTPAILAANGSTSVSLYIDTDSVLGYAHLNPAPPRPARTSPFNLALLVSPFGLFAALASRRRSRSILRLLVLLLAASTLSAAIGCGEIIYPYAVPPFAATGTYTIPIIATGASTNSTHIANLTLQITP